MFRIDVQEDGTGKPHPESAFSALGEIAGWEERATVAGTTVTMRLVDVPVNVLTAGGKLCGRLAVGTLTLDIDLSEPEEVEDV